MTLRVLDNQKQLYACWITRQFDFLDEAQLILKFIDASIFNVFKQFVLICIQFLHVFYLVDYIQLNQMRQLNSIS